VLLSEGREGEYLDLLWVRGMPVEPIPSFTVTEYGVSELVEQFREFVLRDRAFHDKVCLMETVTDCRR
jgi:hypothetical protein